jgi:RHS repeat-associated protein
VKSLRTIRFIALALLGLFAPSVSSEEAKLGIPIAALPAVINAPGVYVLQSDFEVDLQNGAALTIAADNVVIDFNGHAISNTQPRATTEAYAVYSLDRANLTVRNGRIKGFNVGVFLNGSDKLSFGNVVEEMSIDSSSSCGIYLFGAHCIVRRCEVIKIGGSTLDTNKFNAGIAISGVEARILDNSVSEVGSPAAGSFPPFGLYLRSGDGFAVGNRVSQVHTGLYVPTRVAKFRDNIFGPGVAVPFSGGIDAGSTAGLPGGPRRPAPPAATNDPAPPWAPAANYEAWVLDQFNAGERLNQATSGRNADPDNDGRTNFEEFNAGTSPKGWRIPAAGLRLWLRGDLGVTVETCLYCVEPGGYGPFMGPPPDDSPPETASVGGVTQWVDQSTNQITLTNSTRPQRPAFGEDPLTGQMVVHFDGMGTVLQTTEAVDIFQGNKEWTIFIVTQPGMFQEAYANIMDQDHDSVSFAVEQTGTFMNQFGLGVDLIPLQADRLQVVTSVKTMARQVDYINGIQHADLAAGPFSPQVRRFGLGGWLKGERFYNGDIAEIIIYNRALTETERGAVENWLQSRYDFDGDGMPYLWEVANGLNPGQNDGLLDPDGDGLGNLTEYVLGTDPQRVDSDADGMPDGWEVSKGLNPVFDDSGTDWDEDTFTTGDEYRLGTNPFLFDFDSDYDRRPDSVDAHPYDYYNAVLPRITPISGDQQSAVGGQVLAEPLIVRVTDSFGLVLRSAPVQVSSPVSGTAFAVAADDYFFSTASLFTDANGLARVYVRLPDAASAVPIHLTAWSGPATQTVNFMATAVAPPAVAAGEYHTVTLGSSGMVWSWGLNSSGQLGDGTKLQRSLPSPVLGLRNIRAIAAGAYHSLALRNDGTVWAWGANMHGQLGVGHLNDSVTPVQVSGLSGIVAIASGSYHNLALASDGRVFAWGYNGNGQLGDGSDSRRSVPIQVAGMGSGSGVVAIGAGAYHSLAVTSSGLEKGWGANYHGALGGTAPRYLTPNVVSSSSLKKAVGGGYHTMAINSSDGAEALGWNGDGQLGDNTTNSRTSAAAIMGLGNAKSLSASQAVNGHCLGLTQANEVYSWGANYSGQLGRGAAPADPIVPRQLTTLANIKGIAAGSFHSTAVGSDGAIYSWGDDQFGQLGHGMNVNQNAPLKKSGLVLIPTAADTDQDGLDDAWEQQQFGNLAQAGDGDPDGDGLVNQLEYQTVRNPNRVDYEASEVPPVRSQLINLSSRSEVGTGENILIAGFIVSGDAPKTVILRAKGPSLAPFGIPPSELLSDPQIQIYNEAGAVIASNNNWKDNPDQEALLRQYNMHEGMYDADAALVWTLDPGTYTAHISGADGGTGIALFEIYDATVGGSFLANISARARLRTGNNVLISGFIVDGGTNLRAVIRAIGPSLASYGINDALADPHLNLHDGAGAILTTNDDWRQAPNFAEIRESGLAPAHEKESTILRFLTPGVYTAVVSISPNSPNQNGGVALVEVYDLGSATDSDGDGLTDSQEIDVYHTNPHDPDSDDDGIPDGYEVHHGLDPLKSATSRDDKDGDGISDLDEFQAGTNPSQFDFVQGNTAGTTQGKLAVGNNGGASYSIPIAVSPGTAGMQPKLSFEYSSRGGNGVMGMGWSISGLSAITRVPATLAQDGFIHGVDFSATDRFALDGQRLIAISGADGGNNTEYRTELESFTKIVSYGAAGSGPQYFEARTKSGLTYTFGGTGDSRFTADRAEALSWAISKIEDRNGNYMRFHYLKPSAGELLIDKITYTYNDGAQLSSGYASVQFNYLEQGERPDTSFGYASGTRTSLKQRLVSVTSRFGDQVVRHYQIGYKQSAATGRSLVDTVQESAGGLSFDPTRFVWSDETDQLVRTAFESPENYLGKNEKGEPKEQWMEGDFTGDGRSDFVRIAGNSGTAAVSVAVATPDPLDPTKPPAFVSSSWASGQGGYNISDRWLAGDFDGDGQLDLLRFYDNTSNSHRSATQLYKRNPQGTFSLAGCTVTGNLLYKDFPIVYPTDINGDGRLDFIAISATDQDEGARTQFAVFLNQGTTGGTTTFAGALWGLTNSAPFNQNLIFQGAPKRWMIGDVTGDGLPEIIFINNVADKPQINVYLNRNNGTFTRQVWGGTVDSDDGTTIWNAGDFNGDGLVDLLKLVKRTALVTVYLATGQGFAKESWANLPISLRDNISDIRVGDYNGDGRSDIGLVRTNHSTSTGGGDEPPGYVETPTPNSYEQFAFLSDGSHSFIWREAGQPRVYHEVGNQAELTALQWMPADFNGDGREDLARLYTFSRGGARRIAADIWTGNRGVRDQLISVTDAMESTTTLEYKTLTDPLYSKSAPDDVVNEAIDLMAPMPVVSSVKYDNGFTDGYTVSYKYSGLKAHRQRGILGFRSVRSTDNRTGIWSEVLLRQDFPFTGMAVRSETHQPNGALLSLSTTNYLEKSLHGGKVHSPYAEQNITESYDLLNGALTSKTTTITHAMDNFGNTENISVESLDHFKKTTVSTYEVDPVSWQIGKLRDSTVTSSAPGQPDVVRKSGFTYSGTGQVEAEKIEPDDATLWATTSYTPDAFGNTRTATTSGPDIVSRTTTTVHDERGRFIRDTINSLDQTERRHYDERWGSIASVVGPNSLETTTVYDDLGRERLTRRADGSRTITTYHRASDDPDAPAGARYFVRSAVDGAAPVTVFFDRLGREMRKKTFGGVAADGTSKTIFVDKEYNDKGQVNYVSRPYSPGDSVYKSHTIYDLLGRPERIETPKEGGGVAVTTNVYRGLEVDSVNPEQQGTPLKTTTKKDSQGHIVRVTDAKNGTIDYKYDPTGNLIETTQGGHVTTMMYDRRGRKKSMDDPDLGVWEYKYNSLGELIEQKNAMGQIVKMRYDKLGRLEWRDELEGVSTWEYDTAPGKGVGKLYRAVFEPAGSNLTPYRRIMAYDDFGRPKDQTEHIEGTDYTVATGYGAFSRVETITYPTGTWVKQIYDSNGYVNQIQRADGTPYWKAKSYDGEGHLKQQELGNGVVTDRVYVPETGVLKKIQSGLNGGVGVQNLEYQFSVIGNLTKRTDYRQTVNGNTLLEEFEYDELNRVRKATVAGQTAKNFAYDLAGNITSKDGVGTYGYAPAPGSLQQGENSHPHAVRQINGGTHATYDKNGNMTSGFGRTITWTSFNMPNLIQRNGASSRFTYDVDHGRIMQQGTQNGLLKTTIYVGGMYEKVNDGAKIEHKHYIASPAGRIAIYTQTIDQTPQHLGETTVNTKYLHTDHLGSIDVVTDETGATLCRNSFDAWGTRRATDWGSGAATFCNNVTRGFTGHEMLDDLGLVHMNGRVYDPGLGRFLSADPFVQAPTETQNFNRYSYVVNNPLSLTDPSGFNFLGNFGRWLTDNLGETGAQIVIGVIAIAAGVATAGAFTAAAGAMWAGVSFAAGTIQGAVVAGAGFGFGAGFMSTSLSGASLGQAIGSALLGAVIGGISGGIAHYLGGLNPTGEFLTLGHAGQTAGHALVGGALSEIQGGDFGSGALAAGLSAGLAPGVNLIGGGSPEIEYVAARVTVSAVIGGTAAEISGGKFANGAVTAAFLRLYNEEVHLRLATRNQRAENEELLRDPWALNAMSTRQRAAAGRWNAWTYPGAPNDRLGDYHGPPGRLHEQCLANWQELTGAPNSPQLYGGALLSSLDRNHPALRRGLLVGYGFHGPGGTYASQPTGNHAAYVISDGRNLTFYHVFAGTPMTTHVPGLNNQQYRVMISRGQ